METAHANPLRTLKPPVEKHDRNLIIKWIVAVGVVLWFTIWYEFNKYPEHITR